jgi:SAM-dependent methyltransferase
MSIEICLSLFLLKGYIMNKVHIELGCWDQKREIPGWTNIGVDLAVFPNFVWGVDKVVDLGIQKLPFEDNYADFIQAIDVLEHIPRCIWGNVYKKVYFDRDNSIPGADKMTDDQFYQWTTVFSRKTPLIFLMNEIYRVLKPDGQFLSQVSFSDEGFRRDPTHVTHFAEDWYLYFRKDDNIYYDQGLVECNFLLEEQYFNMYKWTYKDIMTTVLKACK